jgi:hypothetical protein
MKVMPVMSPQLVSTITTMVDATLTDGEGQRIVSTTTTTKMAAKDMLSRVLQLLPPLHDASQQLSSKNTSTQCCSHNRTVQFSAEIEVYPVLHRRDMSDDEIQNAWLSRHERRQNRTDLHSTIFLLKTGLETQLSDDDSFCARGLEHLCSEKTATCGYDLAEAKKSQKIALAMQRILRRVGATNPDMIAKAYRQYTLRSRSVAYRKALDDQAATGTGTS